MRNLIVGAIFGIVCGAVLGATFIGPQLVQQIPGFKSQTTTFNSYSKPGFASAKNQLMKPAPVPPPAQAGAIGPDIEWRMASAYGLRLPQLGELAKRVEKKIQQVSGGHFKIRFHGPGSLVAPDQMFDAVQSGTIDAAFTTPTDWAKKVPALALFSAVPFGPTPREYMTWFYFAGGQDAYLDIYQKQGIHSVICGMGAPEASGWFKRKIETTEDLKGLRMRISGLAAKVMTKLGVETRDLSDGDVFVAFEAGTLDAAEFSQPATDLELGLNNMAEHYYFPGWHQPATLFELMINLDSWQTLTSEKKSQINSICGDNVRHSLAQSEALQFAALKELVKQGVSIQSWPTPVLDNLQKAWAEVVAEEIKKDRDFSRVWTSIEKFRLEFAIWRELSQP